MRSDPASPQRGAPGWARRPGSALLMAGAITNCAFLASSTLGATLSPTSTFVSELSASGQPHAWLFSLSDLVTGLLLLAGVTLGWYRAGTNRWQWTAAGAIALFAVCTAIDSQLPLDCVASIDAACRAAEAAGTVALPHKIHSVTGVTETLAMIAACYAIWLGTRHSRAWNQTARLSRVAGHLQLVLSVVVTVLWLVEGPWLGLAQRVSVLAFSATLAAVGATLWHDPWDRSQPQKWHDPDPTSFEIHEIPVTGTPGSGPDTHLRVEIHHPKAHPTVLFSNGLTLPAQFWYPVIGKLPEIRAIVFDRPGLGGSPGSGGEDLAGQVAQLVTVLAGAADDPRQLAPGLVVGHSHGAIVAECLARIHPELVSGLVLVDPSVPEADRRTNNPVGLALLHVADRLARIEWVAGIMGRVVAWMMVRIGTSQPDTCEPSAEVMSLLRQSEHLRASLAELGQEPHDVIEAAALAARYPMPQIPVRILAAASSGWPLYRRPRRWLARLNRRAREFGPAASVVEITGAHLLMLDAPEQVAQQVSLMSHIPG